MNTESKNNKCPKNDVWFGATEEELRSGEIDDWAIYQRDLRKLERMNAGILYAAEVAREEGRAEGHAEGRAEGRLEGRLEVREEVKDIIIRQLYAGAISCEKIADALCIPLQEIERILGL